MVAVKPRLCSQPPDAVDEMIPRMQAETTYPTLSLSGQIRPSSIRTTMMIKMVPIRPTPP